MRRRKICLAAILAAVMALQAPVLAFAEGETQKNTPEPENHGDVTITDDGWQRDPDDEDSISYSVDSWEEGGVTTTGNVTSTVSIDKEDSEGYSNIPAVSAGGQGTVQVNGNVSSQNTCAIFTENGTVKVTGDVKSGVQGENSAVNVVQGGTVEIGGSVANIGTGSGINVEGTSAVKVGGDVTVNSEDSETGMGITVNAANNCDEKGTVEIDGNVSSAGSVAIVTNAASDVAIAGDVTGNTGITIKLDGSGGTIEVFGAVKSTTTDASTIVIETDQSDAEGVVKALPKIVVGSLEGAADSPEDFLYVGKDGADAGDEIFEAVYQQILYYIAQDKFENATLSVVGADAYKNGYISNEGKSLTVTIATADGYEVSSVSGTSVVRNADGTYTVVVQRGKGIDINAVISAIAKAQKEISTTNNNSNKNESSDSATSVIVVPAYAAAQKQFQSAIAAQLKTLPAGGALMLDMKEFISFNKKTFEVLSQRRDVDIQIIYTWKGKRYLVVIPAGYDILSLLDVNGYCGCLYLNSIFGSTELTR